MGGGWLFPFLGEMKRKRKTHSAKVDGYVVVYSIAGVWSWRGDPGHNSEGPGLVLLSESQGEIAQMMG